MELVLASGNAKKLAELQGVLGPAGARVLTPADVGGLPEVIEDRDTFAGNAQKKAQSAAVTTGRWSLADDSGLLVDALGGAPGVLSARYASLTGEGEPGDDAANNAKLLRALDGLPAEQRGARFACTLCLCDPEGAVAAIVEGTVEGRILEAPRGAGGFGYDPLFLFDEAGHPARGRAFAELSSADKAAISHRGRALAELARRWPALTQG